MCTARLMQDWGGGGFTDPLLFSSKNCCAMWNEEIRAHNISSLWVFKGLDDIILQSTTKDGGPPRGTGCLHLNYQLSSIGWTEQSRGICQVLQCRGKRPEVST